MLWQAEVSPPVVAPFSVEPGIRSGRFLVLFSAMNLTVPSRPRLRREMADKPAGGSAMGATFLLFALLCTQSSSPRTPLRCSSQAADSARRTLCSLYLVPLGRGTGRIHMIATG